MIIKFENSIMWLQQTKHHNCIHPACKWSTHTRELTSDVTDGLPTGGIVLPKMDS